MQLKLGGMEGQIVVCRCQARIKEMPKNHFSFFATEDDLVEVLEAVASKNSFQFIRTDNIKNKVPWTYKSVTSIKDISLTEFGDHVRGKNYLLIHSMKEPNTRQVEQSKGGVKYFLDQLSNPESVEFRPGGIFGDFECIIDGQIGTVTDNEWSTELYKALLTEFKKQFTKIRSFYVGKNAKDKMDEGVRLTTNAKAPSDYDLQH